jgi:hypothetical protein
MAESRRNTERALAACWGWLIVGFIGASALAAGLMQLLDRELESLSAPALALSGGILATAGWRRSRSSLEDAKPVSTVATNAPNDPASRALQAYLRRRDSHIADPDATCPGKQ